MTLTDNSVLSLATIAACVLAVVALIISIVSLSQNGSLDINVLLGKWDFESIVKFTISTIPSFKVTVWKMVKQ